MSDVQKKKWYKNWWGIVIAILILPIFAIWYIWSETQWSKSLKIGATIGVVILSMIYSNSSSTGSTSTTTSPTPSSSSTVSTETNQPTQQPSTTPTASSGKEELNATIKFNELAFLITNNEDRDWKTCKLEMNSSGFKSGWTYRTDIIKAKDGLIVPFSEFTKGDGSRFNASTTKPKNISISCDDVNGKHGFSFYEV